MYVEGYRNSKRRQMVFAPWQLRHLSQFNSIDSSNNEFDDNNININYIKHALN